MNFQDMSRFQVPRGFRGKSAAFVQLWWIVQATLFRMSPQVCNFWRRGILRCFGAKVGQGVVIRPSVRVTYPWKVTIGNHCHIGDDVELYSLGEIEIGDCAVISQRSYICSGGHDYTSATFDIYAKKIVIGPETWVATDVFVAPGVTIGRAAVIGARSSVFSDVPPEFIAMGCPAKQIRKRMSKTGVPE